MTPVFQKTDPRTKDTKQPVTSLTMVISGVLMTLRNCATSRGGAKDQFSRRRPEGGGEGVLVESGMRVGEGGGRGAARV